MSKQIQSELQQADIACLVFAANQNAIIGVIPKHPLGDINLELLRRRKLLDADYATASNPRALRHLEDGYIQLDWAAEQIKKAYNKMVATA